MQSSYIASYGSLLTLRRTESAGYLVNWAARLFARAIQEKLAPLGLANAQMPVFFALGQDDRLTQKALAEMAAVEQPTMAATLARMERDGLVRRQANPDDRRSTYFSLTPKARRQLEEVMDAAKTINGEALSVLSATERETLMRALGKIIARLDR